MNARKRILFISLSAFAFLQGYSQQWNFGVEAGYTRNNFHTDLHYSAKNGFKVGALVQYSFPCSIELESGLAYERKGGVLDGMQNIHATISRIEANQMDYLQIPLLAGYRINLGKSFSILPQAGGYINTGIRGSGFISGTDFYGQPYTSATDIFKAYSSSSYSYRPFNRTDAGLAFALNLQYQHVRLKASYELGLSNVHSIYGTPRNRTFGLSVAYMLKK